MALTREDKQRIREEEEERERVRQEIQRKKSQSIFNGCGLTIMIIIGIFVFSFMSSLMYESGGPLKNVDQTSPSEVTSPTSLSPKTKKEVVTRGEEEADAEAISIVAKSITSNKLGITANDLRSKANPLGDGTFVFVPQTRFLGVQRNVIWMVIGGQAFPLNSPSKMVTPSLPWPREAPERLWQATTLSRFSATEAINLVFGP